MATDILGQRLLIPQLLKSVLQQGLQCSQYTVILSDYLVVLWCWLQKLYRLSDKILFVSYSIRFDGVIQYFAL